MNDGIPDTRDSLAARINRQLIADGYRADCVEWVCKEHLRHCTRIAVEHERHACFWCVIEPSVVRINSLHAP
jgi:hypothetical protein